MTIETEKPTRRQRWDAGKMIFTERDIAALTWIGEQYAIRIDHLQRLLGDYAGSEDPLSFDATRKLVGRRHRAGWVEMQRLRGSDPLWVWPTRAGLRNLGRGYSYRNMENNLDNLKRLHATSAIRLEWDEEAARWVSERDLNLKVIRTRGSELLHRPDAELWYADGTVLAIEAELSQKKLEDLAENLTGLLRGEGKPYDEVWYVAPQAEVRRHRRMICTQMGEQGMLTEEEVKRLFIKGYQEEDTPVRAPEPVEPVASPVSPPFEIVGRFGCSEMEPVAEPMKLGRRMRARSRRGLREVRQ